MKNTQLLVGFALVLTVLLAQVNTAFAAQALIKGTVQSITLETNANTAVTTVLITLLDKEVKQTVRITIESALTLGVVVLGGDGNPVINESILGQLIEIDSSTVIDEEQLNQHPVGDALATFFSDIVDLDYETIMSAHNEGNGFGAIAQALWLTRKLDGDAVLFLMIIDAKKNNDFSAFALREGGTTPKTWEQFRKAAMDSKKDKPGIIIADKDNNNEGGNDNGNNGNGNNEGGNVNGNNGNDGNGKDKDKNKDDKKNKDKGKGNDK